MKAVQQAAKAAHFWALGEAGGSPPAGGALIRCSWGTLSPPISTAGRAQPEQGAMLWWWEAPRGSHTSEGCWRHAGGRFGHRRRCPFIHVLLPPTPQTPSCTPCGITQFHSIFTPISRHWRQVKMSFLNAALLPIASMPRKNLFCAFPVCHLNKSDAVAWAPATKGTHSFRHPWLATVLQSLGKLQPACDLQFFDLQTGMKCLPALWCYAALGGIVNTLRLLDERSKNTISIAKAKHINVFLMGNASHFT